MTHLLLTLLLQLLCLIIVSKAEDLNTTELVDSVSQVQYPNLPDGYIAYPDIYVAYKTSDESVTWNEARKRCLLDGARLALIDSSKKVEYVTKQRKNQTVTHVGIHKLFGGDNWAGINNGAPLSASLPWLDGSPDSGPWLCAAIYEDGGGLENHPCSGYGGYVCELSIGDGYVGYPDIGVAYKISYENVTWMEAGKECYNDGAQLAVIDSAKKLEYVKNQRTVHDLITFVGIHNLFDNSEWVSAGNGTAVSSLPWAPGQPNGVESYCLVINAAEEGLSDYPCHWVANYVCERPISNGY